jgi:hypothetical protein
MTGEITLREYLDQRINELKERMLEQRKDDAEGVRIALSGQKDALTRAEGAMDKRLDLLNEFRGKAEDSADRYALRELVDAKFEAMTTRMGRLEQLLASVQGRAIAMAGFGALIGGSAVAALFKLIGGL